MPDVEYEQYVEAFEVTEWRDGCIYGTKTLGCGWFPTARVKANIPRDTNIVYVAASDEFAQNNMTIRRAQTGGP